MAILDGRAFRLWEYRVSHQTLLIRSPIDLQRTTNVDLVFKGVRYLSGPTSLGQITIGPMAEQERAALHAAFDYCGHFETWCIEGTVGSLKIAAAFMIVDENESELFGSLW